LSAVPFDTLLPFAGLALVASLVSLPVHAVTDDENQRFEACKAKLKLANETEVLYAFDWKPPSEPKVVVGPTFFQIPIDAKEGFVEKVNCFLTAGKEGQCVHFNVRSWETGKPVGRFANCRFEMN
jgi:hypothetical protein